MSGITEQPYYNRGKIKVGVFIRDQKLCFDKGNVIKYVCRAGFKPGVSEVSDLRKAIDSLLMLIQHIEEEAAELETLYAHLRELYERFDKTLISDAELAERLGYDHNWLVGVIFAPCKQDLSVLLDVSNKLQWFWDREYADEEDQS